MFSEDCQHLDRSHDFGAVEFVVPQQLGFDELADWPLAVTRKPVERRIVLEITGSPGAHDSSLELPGC
jgi:hypothetical protein